MSFHLYTEDFTFLQIYHSATNYSVFFKRNAPPERPAVCKSLYLVTDLRGLWNSLTKQVGQHKNFWALLFHLWFFSFYQKLAASLHSFMIISQSFAGTRNNEKQDLNRIIGIQFSVHHAPPPHTQLSCRSSCSLLCEPSSPGQITQMWSPGFTFFPLWAGTNMQKEKGQREMRKSGTNTARGQEDASVRTWVQSQKPREKVLPANCNSSAGRWGKKDLWG